LLASSGIYIFIQQNKCLHFKLFLINPIGSGLMIAKFRCCRYSTKIRLLTVTQQSYQIAPHCCR